MAKLTAKRRSEIAKKAARTRKRNANKPALRAKRRTTTRSTTPAKRRKRRTLRQKNVMMGRVSTIGAGALGGGAYLATGLVWKPEKMIGKALKTIIGTVALSFLNGNAAAGYAGAGMVDVVTSAGFSLGARRRSYVKNLSACGADNAGRPVLKDRNGNRYAMNANGQYQRVPSSPYNQGYNSMYPMT